MRKPAFCICQNKDPDQLRGNRLADQRLCFCYKDSTIPLLPRSEISSLWPSSVAVQPGLCGTWSETPKTGFLTTRLKLSLYYIQNGTLSLLLEDKVQSLYFLNPKFQASSLLLWLYSPVCVRPGRTPRRLVFSQHGS